MSEQQSAARALLNAAVAAGAPAEGWTHIDVALTDEDQCPVHGDDADGHCWACHRVGCLADPASCESWD